MGGKIVFVGYFIIGQLPRVSTEDRVVSVFEPSDCLFHVVCKLANSLEYPERIHRGLEWTQLLKRSFLDCLQIFSFFVL